MAKASNPATKARRTILRLIVEGWSGDAMTFDGGGRYVGKR
jgi:hypothetical protein